jgi:hypothetical protein
MIEKINIGNHKNILHLNFGSGDIHFMGTEHGGYKGIVFCQHDPTPIGDATEYYPKEDGTTDDIDNVSLLLTFPRPESITVLVHSLIELQEKLFGIK